MEYSSVKQYRFRLLALLAAAGLLALPQHVATPAHAANPNLVIYTQYEGTVMDPAVDYETGMATVLGNAYDGLVRAYGDKTVKIVPDLATSWSQSKDGLTWTFKLRSGAKFHDGNPVDAAAVKFTFDRILKLQQGSYADFLEIGSVAAPDASTVVFHLKTPFSGFLPSLTTLWGPGILSPKTVLAHQVKGDLGMAWLQDHDAGSGPWMVKQWIRHQKIILDPFPGYWKGWSGQHVGEVVIEWPAASSTQRQAVEHGDADIAINLNTRDFKAVSGEQGISALHYTAQTIFDLRFNASKSPLTNQYVRQALAYSLDYDTFVKAAFGGYGTHMVGMGPTGLANYFPAAHPYTYDLAKAKSLLAKGGFPNGFTMDADWQIGDNRSALMAQIWQHDVKPLGITLNLHVWQNSTWSANSVKAATTPTAWFGQWTMDYADNQNLYLNYYWSKSPPQSGNTFYLKNPVLDSLLAQASTSTDPTTTKSLYQQAMDIAYNEAVDIGLVQGDDLIAMRSNLHGFVYNYLYGSFYYDLYALSKS